MQRFRASLEGYASATACRADPPPSVIDDGCPEQVRAHLDAICPGDVALQIYSVQQDKALTDDLAAVSHRTEIAETERARPSEILNH